MTESHIRYAVAIATVVALVGCEDASSGSNGGAGGTAGTGGGTGGVSGTGGGNGGTGGVSGMGGDAGTGGASGAGGAGGEGGAGGVIPTREWGTAVLLETGNEDASGSQIAFEPSGNAIAVWFQSDGSNGRSWASWHVPTQGWETPELISPAMVTSGVPRVGADASGNAIAVWRQQAMGRFSAWANRYTPGTGWGTAEGIGATDTAAGDFAIEVAVHSNGDAMSVWHQGDGMRANIWANRFTPGGGWETAELIENENGGDAKNSQVAVDANGNAIAVWHQNDGMDNYTAANRYTQGGGWETDQSIDNAPGVSSRPQVASDPAGNAVAVWQGVGLRANRYAQGIGWGTAEDIRSDVTGGIGAPDVAVSPDGHAIVVWPQLDGTRTNTWANRYVPGDGWGTAEIIETDDAGGVQRPQVAMDPDGNAVAVWQQSDGDRTNIWANQYTVGVGWAAAELIENEDLGDANFPQIAVDPDGKAIAVWSQHDGMRWNVWANRLE